MTHEFFIQRCLELAERGRGFTGINPLVGSVLVREGVVIAEGWHAGYGQDHAERMLIKKFDQKILPDDILYVNLEPCCHYGKTPPCTDFIHASGLKTVVYGMKDPNPQVAGQGISQLRDHGITVKGPVLPELCRRFNRGYVSIQEIGRPFITLKRAQLRSGEIACFDGSPLTITSKQQDEWSHVHLRATHDAIAVGVGTVGTDDPQLTVRHREKSRHKNKKVDQTLWQPVRLILNSQLTVPLSATLLNADLASGTIIVADTHATHDYEHELLERGVRILRIPVRDGVFDWNILWSMLTTPEGDFHGISSILVEGGRKTWDIFTSSGFKDEEVLLIGKGDCSLKD